MIDIQFNDAPAFYAATLRIIDTHIVEISIANVNTSGFTTWKADEVSKLGDFSRFCTVYRKTENGVQYSDDGSVWHDDSLIVPESPSQLDMVEAQAVYTAMMTDTLLEE